MQSAAEMPAQMHLHLKAHHPVLAFSCEDIEMYAMRHTDVLKTGAESGGAIQQLEISRELNALHDRLSALDSALANLAIRLNPVMRSPDLEREEGAGCLNPQTELGTQIRSATGRVETHTNIVSDILRRLELD